VGGFASGGAPSASGGTQVGTGGGPLVTGGAPAGNGGSIAGTGGVPTTGSGGVPGAGGGPAPGNGGAPADNFGDHAYETSRFPVPPGNEVYKCQDFPNPFNRDVAVVEMNTELTSGSHHMFAFVIDNSEATLTGSLADCPGGGVEFHEYLTTSGSPTQHVVYPPNVGRILVGTGALRIMVHYVNTSDETREAFSKFTIRYVDPTSVANRAAAIFLNNVGVRVTPGTSTATKSYRLTTDINMLGAASHMHKQGVHFKASTDTGEVLYEGTQWSEPPPKKFDPPLLLRAGTTITWACTYENTTGRTLGFGESAATNEMCIFPGEFFNSTGQQISIQAF
jgi:hypothetical protein